MTFQFGAVPPCDCYSGVDFTSFNCYASSFELAARELANRPEAQDDPSLQDAICRRYGLFLDSMTDDEIAELEHQIQLFI